MRHTTQLALIIALSATVASAQSPAWQSVAHPKLHPQKHTQLLAAAQAAAAAKDPVARELALVASMGALQKASVKTPMFNVKGPVHQKLSTAVVRWMELAHALMKTPKRPLRELAHALLHEGERLRARCRHEAARAISRVNKHPAQERQAKAWQALASSRVTCGETALSIIALQTKGDEAKLKQALLTWPNLSRFCPGIGDVIKNLEKWPADGRSLAIDRRCRPKGVDATAIKRQPAMAVAWTYALTKTLHSNNLLTRAHTQLLLLARSPK